MTNNKTFADIHRFQFRDSWSIKNWGKRKKSNSFSSRRERERKKISDRICAFCKKRKKKGSASASMRWSRSKGKWIGSYSCSATPLTSKGNKGTRGNVLWGKQLPEISFEPLRNKQPLNWMQLNVLRVSLVAIPAQRGARDPRLWTRKNNRRRANSAEMRNPSTRPFAVLPRASSELRATNYYV